jgi:hypothetical protein
MQSRMLDVPERCGKTVYTQLGCLGLIHGLNTSEGRILDLRLGSFLNTYFGDELRARGLLVGR